VAHKRNAESISLPHSWDFSSWPQSVFPGNGKRAKYLFRTWKRDLLADGAVARVGRVMVFFGDGYARFLRKGVRRIPAYLIPPNSHRGK
jgi:hypothetical protein